MANEIINQSKNPAIGTYKLCIQNLATSDVTQKSEVLWHRGDTMAFYIMLKKKFGIYVLWKRYFEANSQPLE